MTKDSQSRKWLITINNPIEKGFSHEKIKEIMNKSKQILYYCMSDEIGENGTFHTHIFCAFGTAIRFSTMLKRFEGSHLDMCKGSSSDNRDYVFKEGKHKNTEKEATNIKDSHYEYGDMPVERQGKRNDLEDLYDMIKGGTSTYDIIANEPSFMSRLDLIDKVRDVIMSKKFKSGSRDVDVTYVWGPSGVGKTLYVYDTYGYENVYRVTDYAHPFDTYNGQDVMVFDEFCGQINFELMLMYLDIHPVDLPARFYNRVACYTKVIVISNYDIREHYSDIRINKKEAYLGFLRRFKSVMYWDIQQKCFVKKTLYDYLNGWLPVKKNEIPNYQT